MPNPENLIGKGFDVNPQNIGKGRPKGLRNRSTIVREALEAIMEGSDQMVVDLITAAAIKKAMAGDIQAFNSLLDSGYGKLTDKSQVEVAATVQHEALPPQEAYAKLRDV